MHVKIYYYRRKYENKEKMKKKKSYITVHIYRCMRRSMRDLRTIYVCTYISIYVQAHTYTQFTRHTYTGTREHVHEHTYIVIKRAHAVKCARHYKG